MKRTFDGTWQRFVYVREKPARTFLAKLKRMGYSPILEREGEKWIVRKKWGEWTKPEVDNRRL